MCAGYRAGVRSAITPEDPCPVATSRGRDNGAWSPGRSPAASPTPRLVPIPRRRGPGHLRREGQEPAQPGHVEYFVHRPRPSAPCQMVQHRRLTSSGSSVRNEVEALFLEFNLIKQHQPRFNIRLKDDKSYPYLAITLDEEWPRAMVMRGAQAQGRPLLRPVRARLRDPRDARPPAAHVPDPHVHQEQVRPAPPARPAVPLRAHREVRGAVRRRHRPRRVHGARRRSSSTSSTASTTPVLDRLDKQMHEASDALEFERAAASARPARRRCARRSSASRWSTPRRRTTTSSGSSTIRSRRRCRCSACARAASSAARVSSSTRSKTSRRPELVGRLVEQLYADLEGTDIPREILVPDRARRSRRSTRSSSRCSAGRKVRVRVPATRRQARAAGDGHAERTRGVRAPQAQARVRPQRARPRAGRAAGRARPSRSAAAHRVLRHLEPPGHRDRRRRWS